MAISQRYLTIANGHMILTGNTLMLYQNDPVNGGPFTTVDTSQQVPGYPAGTTTDWRLNSSMAVLTIPPGATVLYAELTWTSLLVSGTTDYSAFAADPVTFSTPTASTTVAPQFTDNTIDIYTRSADVTALIQAGGSGQYTLGRVAGVNGFESTGFTGNAAGWYLSVIVQNPSEPSRLFQINVGNAFVPALSTIDFTINGFSTPSTGSVTGRLLAGIQRGDPVVDTIPIFVGPDTANLNYQLTRPPMPNNNMIIGIISNTETGALIDTSGTFGNNNNVPNPPTAEPFARWHIDIAAFDISPSLQNNQTSFVTRSISQGPIAVFDYNVYNVQIDAQSADITATKTADKAFAKVGDLVTYTITATNSGTIMADNVTITDTPPAGSSFVPGSVTVNGVPNVGADITAGVNVGSVAADGGTVTVTFQAVINQTPTPNPMVNTATVDYTFVPLPGEPPISGSTITNGVTTQVNTADVSIEKTATPAGVAVDGIITYTLVLSNTGNVPADNVVITDAVPAGTTFVAGSVTGATGTPPTLTLANPIPAGGSATVTFQVQVNGAIPAQNPVPNSASASYQFTIDPAEPDGGSGSAQSNQVTTPVNIAALTAEKTVDKPFAQLGEVLTYTLVLTNTGNVPANNVVITDAVPAGTTFVAGSVTGATGTPPTLTLANPIPAGGSAIVTFQVQVGNVVPITNPVSNQFTANFNYTVDPAQPNGASGSSTSDTATTQVNVAQLISTKTADKTFAEPNDVLTYALTLQNTGNTAANNVVITDVVPTGTSFVAGSLVGATGTPPTLTLANPIAAGGTATVTFQVLVGSAIPVPNPILNSFSAAFTFTVNPAEPDGANGTSQSNVSSTQINAAIVTNTKTVDKIYATTGDVLTYTLTLTNSGNVPANNVVITDAVPTGTSYVPGSLTGANGMPPILTLAAPIPVGGSAVVTYQVKVGNTVPSLNPIPNTASAAFAYTVNPLVPNGAANTALSNTVNTQVNAAILSIVKMGNKSIAYLNDMILYQFAVTNTGNVPADSVVLTDVIPNGTALVAGSLAVNVPYTGSLPNIQLTNPIAPGQTITVSFQVKVVAIPNPNPLVNVATAAFVYTMDPENPDGESGVATSNTVSTVVFQNNYSQQITDLVESVALEEAALAAIMNAEGAKIQRIVAMDSTTPQTLLCLNKSVEAMVDAISILESVLKQKLNTVDCQINGTKC